MEVRGKSSSRLEDKECPTLLVLQSWKVGTCCYHSQMSMAGSLMDLHAS